MLMLRQLPSPCDKRATVRMHMVENPVLPNGRCGTTSGGGVERNLGQIAGRGDFDVFVFTKR